MRPPEYYNVNANLVDGATWILGVADAVDGWGEGLKEILDSYCALNQVRCSLHELLLLESLDLTRRRLELNAAYGLAALVYLSPTLNELIVTDNHFGDLGVAAIFSALGANSRSRLSGLYLARTGAGEQSRRALHTMLESTTRLKKLDLRGNTELDAAARLELDENCAHHGIKLIL